MIIAEIGLDMSRFPTPAHLVSWARFAPGVSGQPEIEQVHRKRLASKKPIELIGDLLLR